MTDRYAVFGNPIAQSKSPRIHQLFAEASAQDLDYVAQLVAPDQFEVAAEKFFAEGGLGLNITLPFKQDAYAFARRLSAPARVAGAVNTLAREGNDIVGYNTDGAGLLHDLQARLRWPVANKRVLILGAGGAVRGVLGPLLDASPALLVIANRTHAKAEQLARGFEGYGPIQACQMDALKQPFDLIINGTSASLGNQAIELPEGILNESSFCYDMVYGAQPTAFMLWAQAHGASAADGLGMLVAQAAESFRIWRGVMPDFVKVVATLRAEMVN